MLYECLIDIQVEGGALFTGMLATELPELM
jgi:hypothetical protein